MKIKPFHKPRLAEKKRRVTALDKPATALIRVADSGINSRRPLCPLSLPKLQSFEFGDGLIPPGGGGAESALDRCEVLKAQRREKTHRNPNPDC